ncbi:hypothetical protein HFC70_10470 [Agrobacterium sp. a22-2]|uniref:hypothetical protein n=1 Tax=Agrobacterium sp. a22-2 TaxID=2283840 RepID=UPI0014482CB2|nr:hypothetical protein [Agrobacterium sp. a22-2]NKN36779.1 hypothetical protein [Agrobacterium sp. a22-2]
MNQSISLDGGRKRLILFDPDEVLDGRYENLVCVDSAGAVVWRAELPGAPDVFLSLYVEHGEIHAHTWSGYEVVINPENGRIMRADFTK